MLEKSTSTSKKKQVKITIILDQPLYEGHSEPIIRDILEGRMAFGVYSTFSQDRVTIEEIEE